MCGAHCIIHAPQLCTLQYHAYTLCACREPPVPMMQNYRLCMLYPIDAIYTSIYQCAMRRNVTKFKSYLSFAMQHILYSCTGPHTTISNICVTHSTLPPLHPLHTLCRVIHGYVHCSHLYSIQLAPTSLCTHLIS